MFKDRIDAALQLAEKLETFKGKDIVVLAIPKGGIPVLYYQKTSGIPLTRNMP